MAKTLNKKQTTRITKITGLHYDIHEIDRALELLEEEFKIVMKHNNFTVEHGAADKVMHSDKVRKYLIRALKAEKLKLSKQLKELI